MGKIPTTLLIRPAARGGKYLGHDAANTKNYSAFVAILHPFLLRRSCIRISRTGCRLISGIPALGIRHCFALPAALYVYEAFSR